MCYITTSKFDEHASTDWALASRATRLSTALSWTMSVVRPPYEAMLASASKQWLAACSGTSPSREVNSFNAPNL